MGSTEESIRIRYSSKLVGNILSGALTFLQQTLVCRTLGPASFGIYTFTQAHLEHILATGDLGFSQALFTLLSQERKRYAKLVSSYLVVILGVVLATLSYVGIVGSHPLAGTLWPSIPMKYMLLGCWLALSIYFSKKAVILTDAAGLALKTEKLRIYRALILCLCLALLSWAGHLSLTAVFLLVGLSLIIYGLLCVSIGHHALRSPTQPFRLQFDRSSFTDMWSYAKPLAIYALIVFPLPLLERWLLQFVGGAVQSGYLGFSIQLSVPIFVIASSILPIYHRESAVAFSQNDEERIKDLYRSLFRRIFCVACALSIFLASNTEEVILLCGGPAYAGAYLTVFLMFLYPIVQTGSELSMCLMLATKRTRQFMPVGIFRETSAFILGYFMVAPTHWWIPGLSLGATGFAIRNIVGWTLNMGLLVVLNCRYLKFSLRTHLANDLALLLVLGFAAMLGKAGSQLFSGQAPLLRIMVSSSIFFPIVAIELLIWPKLFGLEEQGQKQLLRYFFRKAVS